METENTKFQVMETRLAKLLENNGANFDDVNKLINMDLTTPENSIPTWKKMGFLDGLIDTEKIKIISVSMSLAAKYILLVRGTIMIQFDSKLEMLVFPIIRRILQNEDLNLIYDFEKISKFTGCLLTDLNENIKTFDFTFGGFNIDADAEFCAIYSQNFDVKKYFE